MGQFRAPNLLFASLSVKQKRNLPNLRRKSTGIASNKQFARFWNVAVAGVQGAISVAGAHLTFSYVRNAFMKTRKFGGLIVVALAFAFAGVVVVAKQGLTDDKKVAHSEHNAVMQECAKACSDCQRACDTCTTHCAHLMAAGEKDHLACMASCQDCATCCVCCSQLCARGGPSAMAMAECCAKVCGNCAKACEAFPDDKELTKCAAECRKCEKVCKAMAK